MIVALVCGNAFGRISNLERFARLTPREPDLVWSELLLGRALERAQTCKSSSDLELAVPWLSRRRHGEQLSYAHPWSIQMAA